MSFTRPVEISVEHRGQRRRLALCQGVPTSELSELLKSSFGLDQDIVGLLHTRANIIYPLSVLSLDPKLFIDGEYALIEKFDETRALLAEREHAASSDDSDEAYSDAGSTSDHGRSDDDQRLLQFIQTHPAFSRLSLSRVIQSLAAVAHNNGLITREQFEIGFERAMGDTYSHVPDEERIVKLIADRIFDLFDRDGNGVVDFSEFITGISFLCGNAGDDKIRAAFSLFDLDGDGLISLDEMERYLCAFFEVCFALEPNMARQFGPEVTPIQVGIATAEHCFRQADYDGDGSITFEEFKQWYLSADNADAPFLPH